MFTRIVNAAGDVLTSSLEAGQELLFPSVRLGVTGLARSGKTIFITALIHNLLAGGRLPFFAPYTEGRVLRVYLDPQPDDAVPRFDYEGNLAKLTAAEPEWPQSTTQISQLRLTIEFEPRGMLWRAFGSGRMHLDIVDYPGEWLLDLPLLDMSFDEWSAEAMADAREGFRAGAAKDWLDFSAGIDPKGPADEILAREGAKFFTAYLEACRQDALSLSSLSPGRFLMPGDLSGSPAVTFVPLDVPGGASAPKGSLWAMMVRRFEAYKTHVAEPFFRNHFAKLDRQIVLADVLHALNAGQTAVADLEKALTAILKCFRQGGNSWLSLLIGRRIDKIVFAATKADHLHHTSHDRLEAILRLLTAKSIERAELSGVDVEAFALASVRATHEAQARNARGRDIPCIAGVPLKGERLGARTFDGHEELAIFPGDLPEDPAVVFQDDWTGREAAVNFVRFRPPLLPAPGFGQKPVLPHIRLDRALNFLLGDKLS